MGKKRKRQEAAEQTGASVAAAAPSVNGHKKQHKTEKRPPANDFPLDVQIVVGTYEKVLHGFTAHVQSPLPATNATAASKNAASTQTAEFADTFLFSAHTSSIKCLATSPIHGRNDDKVILATGGSDQTVNLYSVSARAPKRTQSNLLMPSLSGHKVLENPRNREIGSLQHHSGSIAALTFPTKSKLLTAAADNTIAVARTHDWTILSTIKAPRPPARGRPSGDTAPTDGGPMGVNDLAVHPSTKLMLSLGKGERCMRLWNLVTGKKAAVLNFDRELLQAVGEAKHGKGEGQRVRWNAEGEEFAVAFERGCAVYGLDSRCKCYIVPEPRTKVHQVHYLDVSQEHTELSNILVLSTEDGRVLFYHPDSKATPDSDNDTSPTTACLPFAELGTAADRMKARIKDFQLLVSPTREMVFIVTATSDGAVKVWSAATEALKAAIHLSGAKPSAGPKPLGSLLGTYETGHRITCLAAFLMKAAETDASAS